MLTSIIIVVLVAALLFVIGAYTGLAHMYRNLRATAADNITTLADEKYQLKKECLAWEQGIEDQAEVYEQQFLSLNEILVEKTVKIERLREDLRKSDAMVQIHDRYCLPILNIDVLLEEQLKKYLMQYDVESFASEPYHDEVGLTE
jgi:gamma-glutamyl phosphate reductase